MKKEGYTSEAYTPYETPDSLNFISNVNNKKESFHASIKSQANPNESPRGYVSKYFNDIKPGSGTIINHKEEDKNLSSKE